MRLLMLAMVVFFALSSGNLLVAECSTVEDCYEPDSVYYLPFSYRQLTCSDSVEVRLPVYLWCDGYATRYECGFAVEGGARFDTSIVHIISPCTNPITEVKIWAHGDSCRTWGICWNYITPASGTVWELVLRCSKSDTVTIQPIGPSYFSLTDAFDVWNPLYTSLDTSFVVPSFLPVLPGDVNCSQIVSISDAVFLINYIFAGGCSPCDPNAADVNHSCSVSISDAVYLINYIFGGGYAPQNGCAVP